MVDLKSVKIEKIEDLLEPPATREIRAPYYEGDHILCEFWMPDGKVLAASISPFTHDGVTPNPDYEEVCRKFSTEELQRNTLAMDEKKQLAAQAREAAHHAAIEAQRAEILINTKIEALGIDDIKHSRFKDLKEKIRKAKNPIEVVAYTSVIMMLMYQESLASLPPDSAHKTSDPATCTSPGVSSLMTEG